MAEPLSEQDRAPGLTHASDLAAELEAVLGRLRRASPLEVLGLAPGADAAAVRAAFLIATKKHHPNRFARHDAGIVRLANEVFLLVRAAYENARTPPTPGAVSGRTNVQASQHDLQALDGAPSAAPAVPRVAVAAGTGVGIGRDGGVTSSPAIGRSPPAGHATGAAPSSRRNAMPTGRIDDDLRAAMAEKRRQHLQRSSGPTASPDDLTGPAKIAPTRAATRTGAPPAVGGGPAAGPAAAADVQDVLARQRKTRTARLRDARAQLADGRFAEARISFRALLAEQSDDTTVRALLHLTAARELLGGETPASARAELERAIASDASLQEARDLLSSLDSKKDAGRFTRWFRR